MEKTFICDLEEPVVATAAGKLRGFFYDGIYKFYGIPYGTAERFHMPEPAAAWEGIRDAYSYGFVCPLMKQEEPGGEVLVPHRYWPQNENCLNLNVWTPSLKTEEKKPVLVWFHGGGYEAGSAIEHIAYDGTNMSQKGDCVVVTVNHRLNILGYLDLSAFGEEYANSVNVGSEDLVLSLKWVKENIAAFGGDPENVTIFGQSGGGGKVITLMQTPSAEGLFQKGMIMSGIFDGSILGGADDTEAVIEELLNAQKLTRTDVKKLETLPYETLVTEYFKAYQKLYGADARPYFGPKKNPYFYGDPMKNGFTEFAKTIPILAGTVISEFAFGSLGVDKKTASDEEMAEKIVEHYGETVGAELIELFRATYPDKKIIDILTVDSTVFRPGTKKWVVKKAEYTQAPTYSYVFALEFPYDNGKLAWHCSDIPFWFHNTDLNPVSNIAGVTNCLEDQMFTALMNFSRTGNPNCEQLPEWPACQPGDDADMIFDRTCEVRHNFDDKLLDALEEHFVLPKLEKEGKIQH